MLTPEVAELTGKRHDHVMRDARKMLDELHGQDAPNFGAVYQDAYGREKPCYRLPKRELMVLVTGYSVAMRAALVDRVEQLEAGRRNSNVVVLLAHVPLFVRLQPLSACKTRLSRRGPSPNTYNRRFGA